MFAILFPHKLVSRKRVETSQLGTFNPRNKLLTNAKAMMIKILGVIFFKVQPGGGVIYSQNTEIFETPSKSLVTFSTTLGIDKIQI